jgi:dipeptidyl aminopeptidase/acylaminoacyl peptidase
MEAEFADPAWIFDRASYGFLPDGAIVAIARADGHDRLMRIEPGHLIGEVETPFTELEALKVGAHTVVALAGAPGDPSLVARFDPVTLAPAGVLRRASTITVDPAAIAQPEAIEFPTAGGRTAHAIYYPPTNPEFVAPAGEKPPLIVLSHGGPTANTSTALDLTKQLMTSRGIAIVAVDYGGSTGYGREYRQRLDGQWGIVDVDDCVAAARFLVERGDVDPARLVIEGGSAGGYTTLAALAFRDVFAAGISHYGIGDLELLESDTHKFESRYSHRLVGPYPEALEVYRQRSPNNVPEAFSSPVLILQGLDDRVVPPSQAESIIAALGAKGIPYAYLAFEGEGHGFRGAHAVRRTIEARISFLGQVFGFEPADPIEPVDMPGLAAWRMNHPRPVAAPVPPPAPAEVLAAAGHPATPEEPGAG